MRLLILFFIVAFTLPLDVLAATEKATFESFYKESTSISWIFIAGLAVVAGVVLLVTGGTASPIVVGIGTWAGNLLGYSGAAATSAGLAFLGGGAITVGGLGMAGGSAFITVALTFSTEVVIDYSIGKVYTEYKYSKLVDNSKEMLTLPLPANNSGSKKYKAIVSKLDDIDHDAPLFSGKNKEIINETITSLESNTDTTETVRDSSFLSLLYFIANDYENAKKYADIAIRLSREADMKRTLPSFIYATSSLYDESLDFYIINTDYFSYAVFAEPNNPLIPLLFSIYLDRMQLRMGDDYLDASSFSKVHEIMESPILKKHRMLNNSILITRYIMQLKLEQQKISSLSSSSNKTIKDSEKTLEILTRSLSQYNILLKDAHHVLDSLLSLKLNNEDRKNIDAFKVLLSQYAKDQARLSSLTIEMKDYQDNISKNKFSIVNLLTHWAFYLVLFFIASLFFINIRNGRSTKNSTQETAKLNSPK